MGGWRRWRQFRKLPLLPFPTDFKGRTSTLHQLGKGENGDGRLSDRSPISPASGSPTVTLGCLSLPRSPLPCSGVLAPALSRILRPQRGPEEFLKTDQRLVSAHVLVLRSDDDRRAVSRSSPWYLVDADGSRARQDHISCVAIYKNQISRSMMSDSSVHQHGATWDRCFFSSSRPLPLSLFSNILY